MSDFLRIHDADTDEGREQVERVARVLFQRLSPLRDYDVVGDEEQELYRDDARAAIVALRDGA